MRVTTWRHCAVVNAVADIVAAAAATVVVVVVVVDVFVLFVVLVGIVTPSSLLTHPSLPYPVFRVRIGIPFAYTRESTYFRVSSPKSALRAPIYSARHRWKRPEKKKRCRLLASNTLSLPSTGSRPLVGKLGWSLALLFRSGGKNVKFKIKFD